ncbi:sensor histidine kinase [Geoalkalibacter halelectricus]|uniref:sensor histidine kinase n=1 Tax=Geoalkalibacter halelectricus TaxID=2847045 RepID=UPI003D1DE5DE
MDGGSEDLLHRVQRVLCETDLDFCRQALEILKVLASRLPISQASLSLIDAHLANLPAVLRSSGQGCLTPDSADIQPDAGWHPLLDGGTLILPLQQGTRLLGRLGLHGLPHPDALAPRQTDLQLICAQLSLLALGELRLQQERRKNTRLRFLTEITRRINQAGSVAQMCAELLATLVREGKAVLAAVHPMTSEADAQPPQVETAVDYRSARACLHQLAAALHAEALGAGRIVQRDQFDQEPFQHLDLPFSALALPLEFDGRVLGTLVLIFSNQPQTSALLTPERDKPFFCDLAVQVAEAWGRISALQSLAQVSRENDRKLREISFLYHISRAMHGTRGLDELVHFILSVTVLPEGPGCERAMIFMINERSRFLQGMLGITHDGSPGAWTPRIAQSDLIQPLVPPEVQLEQKKSALSRLVQQQRLPLDDPRSPVARAAREGRAVLVQAGQDPAGAIGDLKLGTHICVPLRGRDRILAVLITDNCSSAMHLDQVDRRFLELFANQVGAAMESAMLVQQIKNAHHDLRVAQENLLQTEKLATLGEFAASVAHELKNPLVCVGGFAQRLLKQVPEQTRAWDYAEIIAREVRRVEDMLNNILSFSKRRMMCFSECNIIEVIGSALTLLSRELTEADITIVQQLDPDIQPIIGDHAQLRQVLINLFSNARDAMSAGGTLTVRAFPSTLRGDPAVTVEVADTGGGIPADVLRNIFNPFFTTKSGGTGLGLPISHRIMEHHRGTLSVVNNAQGATFTLQLPQARQRFMPA